MGKKIKVYVNKISLSGSMNLYLLLTHHFGNGAGAHGIGKISVALTKIGKICIVFMYVVSIARLIPIEIVNLTLFLDV